METKTMSLLSLNFVKVLVQLVQHKGQNALVQ